VNSCGAALSTLVPQAGQTPLGPQAPQAIRVQEVGGDDELNLRELWRALRRRQRLVLAVAGTVVLLGAANTLRQRLFSPVYEGGFQLLITDPISSGSSRGGVDTSGQDPATGGVIESLARNRTSTDIPTLTQVLTSPMVLEPVAQRLGQALPALAGNLTVKPAGDRKGAAGGGDGVLQVTLRGSSQSELSSALSHLSQAYLNYALRQRQERLGEGISFLSAQEPVLEARVRELQEQLARFRQRNNLLAPEQEGIALKTEVATLEMQQRQLSAERARLQALRRGVAAGRLTAASFSTGGNTTGSGSGTGDGATSDTVSVTQASSDRLDQLRSVEQQLAQARAVYRGDTRRVRSLAAVRNQLMQQLRSDQLTAMDTALTLNATRNQAIQTQINAVDRRFLRQPQLIRQYEELQQNLKVAQANLSNFISTRETFRLEQAQNITPWKVISPPAVNPSPVSPSVPRNLAVAAFLGLGFGAAAGLLRDRLDHVFHSPLEVREELNQPQLGHIPHVAFFRGIREDRRFLIDELDRNVASGPQPSADGSSEQAQAGTLQLSGYQRFFYQEAFRNLFTSLRFLNSEQPLRSVALTSSVPAEGKSLVNVLLAKTLSEMGQRVLLVDADLRKPQLHHRLGLDNLVGLSNVLSGEIRDVDQAIQAVEGRSNWWVLPAGRRPPDPARLLSSQRMHDVVRELAGSGRFDFILYDTPPALGLADAALVAEHLDGLILLVSLGRVDRTLPREAIERLRSTGAPLLGIVTNAVKEEVQSSRQRGYGDGGRYGYGSYGSSTYGSGSLDYRNTYAYYSEDDQARRPAPPQNSLQAWRRRLTTWLDG
jgi:capsular exopolysaccharide synthesis family protein